VKISPCYGQRIHHLFTTKQKGPFIKMVLKDNGTVETCTSAQPGADASKSSTAPIPSFVSLAEGARHSIGVTVNGIAYSWGKSNSLGQLGRISSKKQHDSNHTPGIAPAKTPAPVDIQPISSVASPAIEKAFVSQGSPSDSGHSALLAASGTQLFMAGCDRWQQLGLGSAKGGSSGYTWADGKLWQTQFVPSRHVWELMQQHSPSSFIRDVALGGDHTMILSSNQRDVYTFGKGAEGQLGLTSKPYVSAPVKSPQLSSTSASDPKIAAVCAVDACSMTLDRHGQIQRHAGKCPIRHSNNNNNPTLTESKSSRGATQAAVLLEMALSQCVARAKRDGLMG